MSIQANPPSIDFGRVAFVPNTVADDKIGKRVPLELRNTGKSDVVLRSIHIEPDIDLFIDTQKAPEEMSARPRHYVALPKVLHPDETLSLIMWFVPSGVGHESKGNLIIEGYIPGPPFLRMLPLYVSLTGIASGSRLGVNPELINFKEVPVGQSSTIQANVICDGVDPVALKRIDFDADMSVFTVDAAFPITLRRGDKLSMQIRFSPEKPDPYQTILRSTSDAWLNFAVNVIGQGIIQP